LGVSVDHIPCLQAWADSLGGISYPLLSDFWPHGQVADLYGVLRPVGSSERAIFIIDKDGYLRYQCVYPIDQQPSNLEIFRELGLISPTTQAAPPVQISAASAPSSGIILYCTSWCPDCRRARNWLRTHNLEYTEIDIDQDPDASARVRTWGKGFRITPTFDIHGVIIQNFDEKKLSEALKDQLQT
jgi:glutaredoxin